MRVAIVGTVGVPAAYGGFETLAENLVKHHSSDPSEVELIVYCSKASSSEKPEKYLSSLLRYVPLQANGIQSVPYDIWSILSAVYRDKVDLVLVLGVSGAIVFPLVRMASGVRIITNIDGIEWRREKWSRIAKKFLKFSEYLAVKFSHTFIADNEGIAEYVKDEYSKQGEVIAYGGDHVFDAESRNIDSYCLPKKYVFSVCRIEKENNIKLIVSAFSKMTDIPLVLVGNWNANEYGKGLRAQYRNFDHITLLDPIYDLGILRSMREQAGAIIHGHSAGGTNPALVEGMWFGKPVIAYDCVYNRYTTDGHAVYFQTEGDLIRCLRKFDGKEFNYVGPRMSSLAEKKFKWQNVASTYFSLIKKYDVSH